MFFRAAKSVVKSFGSRGIHINGKNFKIDLIGGAGEVSQTLPQLLGNSTKLNVLALYDVAAVNRPSPNYNFCDEQPFKPIPSEVLTMAKKSCSGEGSHSSTVINSARQIDNNIDQGKDGRSQVEKLVEALYRLPIAEEAPAFNSPLIPIEEMRPKAGNACGRMCLYARVPNERGSSNMKISQKDYATVPIRTWFSDLTYPSFQEYDLSFIPEVKITKKHRSIKETRKIRHPSCSALVAKENNHQSLATSLLNHGEKPARRLMKKFRNAGVPPNTEACCRVAEKSTDWVIPAMLSNNKLMLLREIYSRIKCSLSSLNFINHKRENNREVVSFNRNGETMTDDTLNVVDQENWIQRICSKIKSILPDLHAKSRLHWTIASDSYCSENIFVVNQVISFSDIISNSAIFFKSKDREGEKPKDGIRKKIQECIQRKGFLNKKRDENDICKKRERCKTTERKFQKREEICQKREKICKRKGTDCKERKSPCDKRIVRDCRETRERKVQEDPCKPKKDDTRRIEKDPYSKICEQKAKVQEDPCKPKKDDTRRTEDPCPKICERKAKIQEDPCKPKKDDTRRTEEDPCRVQYSMKQEQTCYKLHDASPCRLEKKEKITKKEEIKKPDSSEIKKVDPHKKKPCSPVKKISECSEGDTKGKES